MAKVSTENKKRLKELQAELKILQEKLAQAEKLEGKDVYIDVLVKKNQSRFEKVKKKQQVDTFFGKFYMEIAMTAKQFTVFVPLSIASGKKTAGFMYHIEGTAKGSIVTADLRVRGKGITQVTLGTLVFAKIPAGSMAMFEIRTTIRGELGKMYKIVFTRLNYKLKLSDARYQQYLKEIRSDSVLFT